MLKKLLWAIFLLPVCAFAQTIKIPEKASYYDAKIIAPNIVNECVDLGDKLSTFTKSYGDAQGFTIQPTADFDQTDAGYNLNIEMTNALSAGNAWMGHAKSVSIAIALYKDGKAIAEETLSRNSGGGFGAGFKGSCDVLGRCTKALGKDIAKVLTRWKKEGKFK